MSQLVSFSAFPFADQRDYAVGAPDPALERRQFANSYAELSPEARELAIAVDRYKLQHGRRFINCEEMLTVVRSLGYAKQP